jgi:flagellar motor switch protein FliM
MIATVEFTIQNIEKQPQFLQILAPTEAVIAIGMEICAGDASGSLNIAIPSLAVKMMHQNFDQQWIKRRTEPTLQEQQRMLQLLEPVRTDVEIAHDGATIRMQDLLSLAGGDLVVFDLPVEKPLSCFVNGKDHYHGHMAQFGGKCLFVIDGASMNG